MKRYLLLLFVVFYATLAQAEDTLTVLSFDEVYTHIHTDVAPKDIHQAILLADSLLSQTSNEIEEIKTYMLLAILYENIGEVSNGVRAANQAEEIADQIKDTEWQMRIAGFMSSIFQNVGLYENGFEYIKKVEVLNKKDQNPLIQLFTHQDKAFYYLNKRELESALTELEKADDIVLQHEENQVIGSSAFTTFQLKGIAYAQMGQLEKAKESFQKADELVAGQFTTYNALLHISFIRAYLEESKMDSAFLYLSHPQLQVVTANQSNLNIELSELWARYYELIGAKDSALVYQNQYLRLKDKRNAYLASLSNEIIKTSQTNVVEKNRDIGLLKTLIFTALFSFFTTFGYFIFLKRKHQKRYNVFVAKIQKAKSERDLEKEIQTLRNVDSGGLSIPEETIQEVLKSLEKFEKGKSFTNPNISLSSLAGSLKINSKYLSQIINTYKEKDFNNYINELRVLYITEKILTEEIYLSYKIAYLAEEAGFSSHSRFSAYFKQITGTSPSVFIQERKKELVAMNN